MADDPNSTSDTPADQPRTLGSVAAAPPPAEPEPTDQPSGVVAMVRLAAVLIDPDGRIALWNRGAEELFGHRTETVQGRTAGGLLPAVEPRSLSAAPVVAGRRCDAFDTLDDLTRSGGWAGLMPVTDREERSRSVLWWAYPLVEPDGRGLLALAADARPLRARGPRIAIGRRLLPYAAAETNPWGAARPDTQGNFRRISAALGATTPGAANSLAPLLPRIGAVRLRAMLRQVAAIGAPALWVDDGTRLPVVPYEPLSAGVAQLAAGLGRRYPTAQQRSAAAAAAASSACGWFPNRASNSGPSRPPKRRPAPPSRRRGTARSQTPPRAPHRPREPCRRPTGKAPPPPGRPPPH